MTTELAMNSKIMTTEQHLDDNLIFRQATGLPVNSQEPNLETHKKVILEEYAELADALQDTIVTCAGLYHDTLDLETKKVMLNKITSARKAMAVMNISEEKVAKKVQDANLSKVCSSMDVAKKTKEHYWNDGIDAYIKDMPDGSFAVYSSMPQTSKSGKFFPAHKLLKSVEWFEPSYEDAEEWLEDEDFLSVFNK